MKDESAFAVTGDEHLVSGAEPNRGVALRLFLERSANAKQAL